MFSIEAVLKFQGVLFSSETSINEKGEKFNVKRYTSSEASYIWKLLSSTHPPLDPNNYVSEELLSINLKISDLLKVLEKNKASEFRVILGDGILEYGNNPSLKFSRLNIRDLVKDEEDAEKWIRPFINEDLLVQARIYDTEYDYWQNATDLLEYEACSRSYEHLQTVSNGLPFPLEQKIIDTSKNPGRWDLKKGFIESIGSVMWLGEGFLKLTGTDKSKVIAADWIKSEEGEKHIKIIVSDKPFITSKGHSGVLQNKLRALLYRNA